MSWASRRRFLYLAVICIVFAGIVSVPLAMWLYEPPRCDDGIQNAGETAIDKGGPCKLLDERRLSPHAILWTRAFPVRDGSYSAIAYVENPNEDAGVAMAPYRFKLYDDRNVLVADTEGTAFIMPGAITPVFAGGIDTGNRRVARSYFEFTAPLVWERLYDATEPVVVVSKSVTESDTAPRLTAVVENMSVSDVRDVRFVATIFDTAGNAFAGSSTLVPLLQDGERKEIVFTWPVPFEYLSGRVDVLPVLAPVEGQ